jgi:transcriptional regulator with XRE-family HTH domain
MLPAGLIELSWTSNSRSVARRMAASDDPNVQRRRLKTALRKAREDARLTQRDAAKKLEWSPSKLIRIEAGAQGLSVTDLQAMFAVYELADAELLGTLKAAARASRGHPWWSEYRDLVSPNFAQYLGHEGAASSFRIFHPFLVPGLLQTEDYAAAVLGAHPEENRAAKIVELRMRRQDKLFQRPELEFEFVVNEEALHRWIGGASAMRRQLEHLREMSGHPNVSIFVLPYSSGAHPGLRGPFVLLGLDQPDGDLLFLESVNGDQLIRDDPEQVARYATRFEALRGTSLPEERGRARLAELIDDFARVKKGAADTAAG